MVKQCPACRRDITWVKMSPAVSSELPGGPGRHVVCHCCPECNAILGVEIDPIRLKTEIAEAVKKAIGR